MTRTAVTDSDFPSKQAVSVSVFASLTQRRVYHQPVAVGNECGVVAKSATGDWHVEGCLSTRTQVLESTLESEMAFHYQRLCRWCTVRMLDVAACPIRAVTIGCR